MSRTNTSQYAVLSLLSKKKMSGYDIKMMAHKVSPFHWSESSAQIYPILKKLEIDQFVSSHLDESSGDRQRRIYAITEKGLDFLKAWLKETSQPTSYREEMLLKLTAGEHVPVEVFIKHLESYHEDIQKKIKALILIQENINISHENGVRKMYLLMTYDHASFTLDAKLKWCEKSLQQLKGLSE